MLESNAHMSQFIERCSSLELNSVNIHCLNLLL